MRTIWASLPLVALMFAVCVGGAQAQPGKPVARKNLPPALTVQLLDAEGREETLRTVSNVFRIETDYGFIDIRLEKVKTIELAADGDSFRCTVELLDTTRLKGQAMTKSLLVEGEAQPRSLAGVRQLRVIHDAGPSPLSLAFGLVMLTVMEIVLGIDNIIFLAIVAGRLPPHEQRPARRIGLFAALATRLGLLFTLSILLSLTRPFVSLPIPGISPEAAELSWRDIILLAGGGFLILKSVRELHHRFEESKRDMAVPRKPTSFLKTIALIAMIDIVFSLDSVITAVGMVDTLWVMITAMVLAMLVMLLFAEPVSRFVDKYPTIKVLALSFLILIGVLLVAEGMGQHIDKGYVYFAMAFAVLIEFLNMQLRLKPFAEAVADG